MEEPTKLRSFAFEVILFQVMLGLEFLPCRFCVAVHSFGEFPFGPFWLRVSDLPAPVTSHGHGVSSRETSASFVPSASRLAPRASRLAPRTSQEWRWPRALDSGWNTRGPCSHSRTEHTYV